VRRDVTPGERVGPTDAVATVTAHAASLRDARPIAASIDGLRENLTAIGRETSVEVL